MTHDDGRHETLQRFILATDVLLVLSSPILNRDRQQIIERAGRSRLPAMYEWREQVEVGGLMSYGSSLVANSQRVAVYVDISKHAGRVNDESILVDEIAA